MLPYYKYNNNLKPLLRGFSSTTQLRTDELPLFGGSTENFVQRKQFKKFDSFFNTELYKDKKTGFFSYHTKQEFDE
jgi:hypothetical protein